MKLALVLHAAAAALGRAEAVPQPARDRPPGDVVGRRGDRPDRRAARPRHGARDRLHARRAAGRGRAAAAPAGARRGCRRGRRRAVRALRALPARAADRLPVALGPRGRDRLPVGAGADRDRLGRAVRARPRPVRAEDLLPARGPHRLHPRGHRRGARFRRDLRSARPLRHDRLRRAADREGRDQPLRQAAGRRPHLADPVPGPAQHLHRARTRAAHRRAAAVHLVGLDVADRAAGRDGAAAERRERQRPRCAPSEPRGRSRHERTENRDRGRRDGRARGARARGGRRAAG